MKFEYTASYLNSALNKILIADLCHGLGRGRVNRGCLLRKHQAEGKIRAYLML